MSSRAALAALAALALLPGAACRHSTEKGMEDGTRPRQGVPRKESDLARLMHAKLAVAQEILEGLAAGDFARIEAGADRMYRISMEAAWMVTDSVTYVVYSEQFREIVQDMGDSARAGDLEAVTAGFSEMTATCVACHTWLRQERITRDYPQRISRPARDPLEMLAVGGGSRDPS